MYMGLIPVSPFTLLAFLTVATTPTLSVHSTIEINCSDAPMFSKWNLSSLAIRLQHYHQWKQCFRFNCTLYLTGVNNLNDTMPTAYSDFRQNRKFSRCGLLWVISRENVSTSSRHHVKHNLQAVIRWTLQWPTKASHFYLFDYVVIGKAPASFFNLPSFWPRQEGLLDWIFLGRNEPLFPLFIHSMRNQISLWSMLSNVYLICAWSCQSKRPACLGQNVQQLK